MKTKCVACGSGKGLARFAGETFTIAHAGMKAKVEGLSGWRCEVEFDAKSAKRYAEAACLREAGASLRRRQGDALVMRDRAKQSKEFRRIRRKLGLSQVAAARLTGGGHNASRATNLAKPRRCQPWSTCSDCSTNIRNC
jgi:HTH-type transcriptional regulator/antitoxin MqsA